MKQPEKQLIVSSVENFCRRLPQTASKLLMAEGRKIDIVSRNNPRNLHLVNSLDLKIDRLLGNSLQAEKNAYQSQTMQPDK